MNKVFENECYFCRIIVEKDEKEFKISLASKSIKMNNFKSTEIKMPINCADENKVKMISSIRKWYIDTQIEKNGDPDNFMKLIDNKLKTTFRIREWMNEEDLIKKKEQLAEKIDTFTEYIECFDNYQETLKQNAKIGSQIELLDDVLEEMRKIKTKHPDVQYSYGVFRCTINGETKFKKFNKRA